MCRRRMPPAESRARREPTSWHACTAQHSFSHVQTRMSSFPRARTDDETHSEPRSRRQTPGPRGGPHCSAASARLRLGRAFQSSESGTENRLHYDVCHAVSRPEHLIATRARPHRIPRQLGSDLGANVPTSNSRLLLQFGEISA